MHVTIVGCGYVGLALGSRLLDAGHDVVGARRSETGLAAVAEAGLEPVAADVTDPATLAALPDTDAVVFAASNGGGDAAAARAVYVEGLRDVVDAFAARADPPERLVYASSTGVYGDHDGEWVDEETPVEATGEKTRALVDAERVAREYAADAGANLTRTVVRFAGLYGPGRYRLERYLEGPVTEGYRNLLHRDDAAGVLAFVLGLSDPPGCLLAVDDDPVSRWAFADWLADACDVPRPQKQTVAERLAADEGAGSPRAARRLRTSKRCSNARLHRLGYEFAYPTFREGYRAAVETYREDSTRSR